MEPIDRIYEDDWIENHSMPCVEDHLERNTVFTIIQPEVRNLQNEGINDDEFVIQISEKLQTHHEVKDISRIIDCIIEGMMFEYRNEKESMSPALLSIPAFTIFGKCILILGKRAGFIN